MTERVIRINDTGFIWEVDMEIIADNRAHYYAHKEALATLDYPTIFEAEMEFIRNDPAEGLDWFQNNMDWDDIKSHAKFIERPEKSEPDITGDQTELSVRNINHG